MSVRSRITNPFDTRARLLAAALASLVVAAIVVVATGRASSIAPWSDDDPSPEQLYVAPNGSDAWPGTAERPFATPARAQQAVRERTARMDSDIVVNLRGGIYTLKEPLRFSASDGDSGTGGHSVIYQAFAHGTERQEIPVLSGGRLVTGWRPAERAHGAWRADVGPLETRQLFVGGRRAQRTALGRGLPGKAIALPTGYAIRSTVPQSWQRPEAMELVFNGRVAGLGYSEARCGVSNVRGDAEWSLIVVDQPCFRDLKQAYDNEARGAAPGPPTDVENSLSFLREPGSWYLDRSRPGRHVLYYLPRRGEDLRRLRVVAAVLEQLIVGEGTARSPLHDIAFRGLTFSHATWLPPIAPTGFPQIIGSWFYSAGAKRVPGHVALRAAEQVRIEDNHFTHLGGQALVLSAVRSDNAVRGNIVDDVSGGGIEVRGPGHNNRLEDNWVHDIGVDYRSSIGIVLEGAPYATVAHNSVENVPYTGIWGEAPRGLQVVNNFVRDAVSDVPDGGGIYLPGAQGTSFDDGAVVRGNVVRDAGGVGVYPDVGADRVTLEANVLLGSDNAVSGVQPKRIAISDNYWDNVRPYWWPKDAPTKGVVLTDNTLLPRVDALAACRDDDACADILAAAGRGPGVEMQTG